MIYKKNPKKKTRSRSPATARASTGAIVGTMFYGCSEDRVVSDNKCMKFPELIGNRKDSFRFTCTDWQPSALSRTLSSSRALNITVATVIAGQVEHIRIPSRALTGTDAHTAHTAHTLSSPADWLEET